MESSIVTSVLFATIVAGTPLIIVALGQLIAEKSGVLNLGAEGMMSMGAIAGTARYARCSHGLWRSLVSALDWGSRGREFKSPQPDKSFPRSHGSGGLTTTRHTG